MDAGFVNGIVRRATLKSLFLALGGMAAMLLLVQPSLNYYRNVLTGPFAVNGKDLEAIRDINSLDNYFFSVHGDEAFDTGSATIWSYVGIELYRDKHTVISLGDRLLLVETSRDPNSLDYSGELKPVPPGLQAELIDATVSEYPELKGAFYPFMLDEGMMGSTFRLFGFITIAIVLGIFAWCVLALRRSVERIIDPSRHPIMKALGRYGDAAFVAAQIEREFLLVGETIGKIHFTPNWVIYRSAASLEAVQIKAIVWVYEHIYTQYVNGIPVHKSYSAYIWDRHGKLSTLPARKKQLPDVMQAILRRTPWAAAGYSQDLHNKWLSNRNEFIAAVDQGHNVSEAA
jgi:hypothetical protein